ncbi:MAG TPA: SAM-dependent methyltransferase [Verrucomicrobiae bacterium]|nr:SAM-dependent methyltransferase [Verrucomicrobiae bacterium]
MISFARFMELALYCPDCGYYEKENDRLGRRGDFYTSVRVGTLFGELLAFQFAEWLATLSDTKPQLVEIGAHDGQLAKDILTWLRKWRPALFEGLEYVICEPSARRTEWQRHTLENFANRVRWISGDLKSQSGTLNGVVFSNELLDAMPLHRLSWDASRQEWLERGVCIKENQFAWERMERSGVLNMSMAFQQLLRWSAELRDALPDGFSTEISPAAEKWWTEAAAALQRGWLLTLDYGLSSIEFLAPHRVNGTLRGYRGHKLSHDFLANPGEQDLTAHVHFDSIQLAGESTGLRTALLQTQASFFAGIMERFWPEAERCGAWTGGRSRQFQTLVHPEHLGRAFQVLVQTR